MSIHPALNSLSPTRRALLDALKKRGPLDAEGLAGKVGVTVSAVRQQLTTLERDGLVRYETLAEGPGRPRNMYRLSDVADALYPRNYGELTNELLDFVRDTDPELVDSLFERRRERRIARARDRLANRPLDEKVAELARILDEDGYVAEAVDNGDGTYTIAEHNCAIFAVALRYGQACGSELGFIRAVLPGAEVERTSHMVMGAQRCAYLIRPA